MLTQNKIVVQRFCRVKLFLTSYEILTIILICREQSPSCIYPVRYFVNYECLEFKFGCVVILVYLINVKHFDIVNYCFISVVVVNIVILFEWAPPVILLQIHNTAHMCRNHVILKPAIINISIKGQPLSFLVKQMLFCVFQTKSDFLIAIFEWFNGFEIHIKSQVVIQRISRFNHINSKSSILRLRYILMLVEFLLIPKHIDNLNEQNTKK